MFLEQAVRAIGLAGESCLALDLCAAPGGKSTHLLSLLGADALLVSNEVVRPRARILCDNITKWGQANVCVTGSDPSLFSGLPDFFDLVVVDAPCSGEGLFRKDEDAMQHWSEEAVVHCTSRQMDILKNAWATLRPGGHIIYSTCTYNRTENEENVGRMLAWGGACVSIPLSADWGVIAVQENGVVAYRFMPHLTAAEGFFLSVVRKPENGEAYRPSVPKHFWNEVRPKELEPWMTVVSGDYSLVRDGERILAISSTIRERFAAISSQVYPLQYGVEVAQFVKGQWVPSHQWVASSLFSENNLPVMDVDLPEAIHYLRGNPVPANGAKGFAAVRFKGLALGLVKGAGNRWNNLYPSPLRIRDMRTGIHEVITAPI